MKKADAIRNLNNLVNAALQKGVIADLQTAKIILESLVYLNSLTELPDLKAE